MNHERTRLFRRVLDRIAGFSWTGRKVPLWFTTKYRTACFTAPLITLGSKIAMITLRFCDQSQMRRDRALDQRQIITYLGISRTQFWRVRRAGDFPTPLHLSQGICRWRRSQLQEWLQRKERP